MKHKIEIKRTAHYYVQEPIEEVSSVLFVIHGYAQLAEEFLLGFEQLKNSSVLVIAPEAISKFYNKERRAVTSWMTAHERLDEIHDHVRYLNELYTVVNERYPDLPFSVLGFSQGVSTMFRWLKQTTFDIKSVFACSGTIPPELNHEDVLHLKETEVYYYFGDRDRLLSPENARKQIEFLEKLGIKVTSKEYNGRHEISDITIKNLIRFT